MNGRALPALVFVLVGALFGPRPVDAQTIRYVDNIGSCDGLTPCYTTITGAVDAAAAGDTIAVFASAYPETVSIISKGGLVLQAHEATLKPVIAPSSGAGVVIDASPQVQVLGFVIEGGIQIGSPGSSNYVIQGNWIHGEVSSHAASNGTVRDNTVVGAGLSGDLAGSLIEANTFVGGGISLSELSQGPNGNTIRHNVLRGGGINLDAPAPSGNTVESNFVSGSPGDGISVGVGPLQGGGVNLFRDNTSVENGGCDIDDRGNDHGNTWTNNRFATKCGNAIGK